VDHDDAVARHAHVHLERVDADGDRVLEARQRVLGQVPARSAMALQVESYPALAIQDAEKKKASPSALIG